MTADIFQAASGNTELTPEERLDLIPSLVTRSELNEIERRNIYTARVWAMHPRVLQRQDLVTDSFSRELHKQMFNQVWRWAGCYRTTEKNIGWEVNQLTEGVRHAFDDAQYWVRHSTYPLHETAVRLHYRLVAIHSWPNGNGRHSRLMADIILGSHGAEALTWGAGSDLIEGEARRRYIDAIHHADTGDLGPLLAFARS